jgi:hypothetical protein
VRGSLQKMNQLNANLDAVFARVVGEQMDEYVHTEVLYYPIGAMAGMQMPQLTIGVWLEAQWRLKALAAQLSAAQQRDVDAAQLAVQRVRSRAGELYKQKARREFKSCLDTWTWYLDDVLAHEPTAIPPEGQAYATQTHVRFRLELLQNDVPQMQDQLARLTSCDRQLRARFTRGAFVWDAQLQPYAAEDTFWFLYGHPGG